MKVTGLFLAGDQLVPGMTVAVAREGRPVLDEENIPLVLQALLDLEGKLRLFYGLSRSYSLDAFEPDIRFMPVKVYTPAKAPNNTEYAVFVNKQCVRRDSKKREAIMVVKNRTRDFCLACQRDQQYRMPMEAKLVPIS